MIKGRWQSKGIRLDTVLTLPEPEIESTRDRRHVSRNKFSDYRVYFRSGPATCVLMVAYRRHGDRDLCSCRCNLRFVVFVCIY